MADRGYIVDENKLALIEAKHELKLRQILSAYEDPFAFVTEDPGGDWERFMIVGCTTGGHTLQIICIAEDLSVTRIITGFKAEPEWVSDYERQQA